MKSFWKLLCIATSYVACADTGKAIIEPLPGGFQPNNAIRTKFYIDRNSQEEYSITLWEKKVKNGRSVILVPLQIKLDGKRQSLVLQERARGKWVMKSRSKNDLPLYIGKENVFVARVINCQGRGTGRTCELSLKLNGKNLKPFLTGNVQSLLRWKQTKFTKITHVKCESDGLINMCAVSEGTKDPTRERRWRTLSKAGCGRTFSLTGQQKMKLPSSLLSSINSNVVKKHLDSCLAYRHGSTLAGQRIIGGENAIPGMEPWIAAIRVEPRCGFLGEAHKGAATLISKCWLVTAAHVFQANDPQGRHYTVRVGDYYNRGGDTDCRTEKQKTYARENGEYSVAESVHESRIKQVIVHDNWDAADSAQQGGGPWDLALIELEKCVPSYNQFIQPACLPDEPEQFKGVCGVISGWGVTAPGQRSDDRPAKLQVSSISILSDESCSDYGAQFQKTSAFCGGLTDSTAEHRDTCQGDSGGPFTVYGHSEKSTGGTPVSYGGSTLSPSRKDRGILWGVTSFGSAECDKQGVYTKVSNYMEWMHGVLSHESTFTTDN